MVKGAEPPEAQRFLDIYLRSDEHTGARLRALAWVQGAESPEARGF